jgi:hypothetical protein
MINRVEAIPSRPSRLFGLQWSAPVADFFSKRLDFEQVGGSVLILGPLIPRVKLDAQEVARVLKDTVPNPAMVTAVRIENRNGRMNGYRVLDLETSAAGRDVLQQGQLLLFVSRLVRPDDLDQFGAQIALITSFYFYAHGFPIGISVVLVYSDKRDSNHMPGGGIRV